MYLTLPSVGALLGGPHVSLDLVGSELRILKKNQSMESSLVGNSSKDSKEGSSQGGLWCMEALQGAAGQNPCLQGLGETPVTWGEHISPSILARRILRCWQRRSSPLVSKVLEETTEGLLRSRRGRPEWRRSLLGLGQRPASAASRRPITDCKSPEHLGPRLKGWRR